MSRRRTMVARSRAHGGGIGDLFGGILGGIGHGINSGFRGLLGGGQDDGTMVEGMAPVKNKVEDMPHPVRRSKKNKRPGATSVLGKLNELAKDTKIVSRGLKKFNLPGSSVADSFGYGKKGGKNRSLVGKLNRLARKTKIVSEGLKEFGLPGSKVVKRMGYGKGGKKGGSLGVRF